MKNRWSVAGIVVGLAMAVSGWTAGAEEVPDSGAWLRRELPRILTLHERDLVPVGLSGTWQFVPGPAPEDWSIRPRTGVPFQLKDARIDLDTLSSVPPKFRNEAVLYCAFEAPAAGIARIGIGCDWYFDARINGVPCCNTLASGNMTGSYLPEDHPFFLPVQAGRNLLAVRVLRGSYGWTFACGQVPFPLPDLPQLSCGPWLDDPGPGTVTVRFGSVGRCGAGVEYRPAAEPGARPQPWLRVWDEENFTVRRCDFHRVTLSGLVPGARYEYRVVMIDPETPGKLCFPGNVCTFTAPDDRQENFAFLFTADLQYPLPEQRTVFHRLLQSAGAERCDLVILGGDIGHNFALDQLRQGILAENDFWGGASRPLVWLRGNHEFRGAESSRFAECFGTASGRTCGVFRFGDTAFLRFDTLEVGDEVERSRYLLVKDFEAAQQRELDRALASPLWRTARHRILLSHCAPSHSRSAAAFFAPRFAGKDNPGKIDLMLTGHTHVYCRTVPGTEQTVTFDEPAPWAAADSRNYAFPVLTVAGPHTAQPLAGSIFRVDVSPDKLVITAFHSDGRRLEKFALSPSGQVTKLE